MGLVGYVISRKPQPEEWLGEHYLACTHSFNSRNSIDYVMYCNVLKTMPDGRLKVRVFGYRWTGTDGSKIRYVEDYRVLTATEFKD